MSGNWADIFRKKKPEPLANNKQKNLNRAQWKAPASSAAETKPAVAENFVYDVKPANAWRQRLIKRALNGDRVHYKEPWKTRRNFRRMSPLNPNFKRTTVNRKRTAPNTKRAPIGNFLTNDELYN
jgi:hypothetical protein